MWFLVTLLTCDIQFATLLSFFTTGHPFILSPACQVSLDFIACCQLLFLYGMETGLYTAYHTCNPGRLLLRGENGRAAY